MKYKGMFRVHSLIRAVFKWKCALRVLPCWSGAELTSNFFFFLFPLLNRAVFCSQLLWGGAAPMVSTVAWPAPSPAWLLCSNPQNCSRNNNFTPAASSTPVSGPEGCELVGSSRCCHVLALQEVPPLPDRQQPLDARAQPRVLRQELLRGVPPR